MRHCVWTVVVLTLCKSSLINKKSDRVSTMRISIKYSVVSSLMCVLAACIRK